MKKTLILLSLSLLPFYSNAKVSTYCIYVEGISEHALNHKNKDLTKEDAIKKIEKRYERKIGEIHPHDQEIVKKYIKEIVDETYKLENTKTYNLDQMFANTKSWGKKCREYQKEHPTPKTDPAATTEN